MKIDKKKLYNLIYEEITSVVSRDDINQVRANTEEKEAQAEQLLQTLLETMTAQEILTLVLNSIPLDEKVRALSAIHNRLETLPETSQSGGSQPRPKTDFDLKYTSTNVRDREKKKNLRKIHHGSKPGGRKKQYKKQSTKADREQGKKLARGDKE